MEEKATQSIVDPFGVTIQTDVRDDQVDIDSIRKDPLKFYYDSVKEFSQNCDYSTLSSYRSELMQSIAHRIQFQEKVFGRTEEGLGPFPETLFSGFIVSLVFSIFDDSFSFCSVNPGFSITGPLVVMYKEYYEPLTSGFLPIGLFPSLIKLDLTWYDGGLICEIVDHRRKLIKATRIMLRINPSEQLDCSPEQEQDYLLSRYPLLCLDPEEEVSVLSRCAYSDKQNFIRPTDGIIDEEAMYYAKTSKIEIIQNTKKLSVDELREQVLQHWKL